MDLITAYSILMMFVGGVGLVVWYVVWGGSPAQDREMRRLAELADYVNGANAARQFPPLAVRLNLQPGEVGLMQVEAGLSEAQERPATVGVGVVAGGVMVGGSRAALVQTRAVVDRGALIVTTRRAAFIGGSRSLELPLTELLTVETVAEAAPNRGERLVLHSGRYRQPIVLHMPFAALPAFLIRLFASGALPDNRLPEGCTVAAHNNGRGRVEFSFEGLPGLPPASRT